MLCSETLFISMLVLDLFNCPAGSFTAMLLTSLTSYLSRLTWDAAKCPKIYGLTVSRRDGHWTGHMAQQLRGHVICSRSPSRPFEMTPGKGF